ncbi:class F sortase [Janibacter anophelis]|uniref:class F sortase n=1 Tax=Janibacter anophelis TaxID=319054 RepID=UPI003F81F77E
MAAADATEPATRMRIPAVGLSTQIEPQGLRGGKVNPAAGQVIWFTGYDRVRPGALGTTVVAGHVISGGEADSFAALEQLSKGDGVVLDYPGGEALRFEVTSTHIVDKDELTTSEEVWGDNDDTRRIVLVTCDDELGFRSDGHRKANFVAVAELPA